MKKDKAVSVVPKWSPKMKEYIIHALATWHTPTMIWNCVTSDAFTAETGIAKLDPAVHLYDTFYARCKRVPADVLTIEYEKWRADYKGVRWAEEKARVEGLSKLLDVAFQSMDTGTPCEECGRSTQKMDVDLIESIQKLMEQIRKERNTDLDRAALSGAAGRTLLANPLNMMLDAALMMDMILTFRSEIGGLHKFNWSALSLRELDEMAEAIQSAKSQKISNIPITEVSNDDD